MQARKNWARKRPEHESGKGWSAKELGSGEKRPRTDVTPRGAEIASRFNRSRNERCEGATRKSKASKGKASEGEDKLSVQHGKKEKESTASDPSRENVKQRKLRPQNISVRTMCNTVKT